MQQMQIIKTTQCPSSAQTDVIWPVPFHAIQCHVMQFAESIPRLKKCRVNGIHILRIQLLHRVVDLPAKNELVAGEYEIPEDAGTIRVKITDLLSESLEMEVSFG